MKVMCISNEWIPSASAALLPTPMFGDIDEVTDSVCYFGGEYYELQRFPDSLFHVKMFAPLSDLDETNLVSEDFEEKYCVPVNR